MTGPMEVIMRHGCLCVTADIALALLVHFIWIIPGETEIYTKPKGDCMGDSGRPAICTRVYCCANEFV